MRTYLYIDAAPADNVRIMSAAASVGGLAGSVQLTTGRVLRIVDHNGSVVATGSTQVGIGNWVRVELDIFGDASAGTMSARLYLDPDSTTPSETISASSLNTGGSITQLWFGISSTTSASVTYWLGEMAAADTGAVDPTILNPEFLVIVADMQPGAAVNPPPSVVAGKITALSPRPDYVLMPGDLANDGTATQYGFFQTMYGSLMDVIYPVPGNHDWVPGNLTAYDGEFTAEGHSPQHYYSFNTVGGWHIIGMESDAANVGAPNIGTAQYNWLVSDLAANTGKPIIAFWHHPRWGEGTNSTDPGGTGDSVVMQDVWNLLRDYNADLVFTGHIHSYQRFPKFGKTGTADANGIREFVVGTGGSGLFPLKSSGRRTEVDSYQATAYDQLNSQWFGYLKLWTTGTQYSWQFISQNAGVLDSGGPVAVNNAPAVPQAITGSESPAISIAEASSVFVTIASTDTAAISVAESRAISSTLNRTDSVALSIVESRTLALTIISSDSAAVSVTEASNVFNNLTGNESIALSINEARAIAVTQQTTDAVALSISDSSNSFTTVGATDASSLAISETSSLLVIRSTSDTSAISIADASLSNLTLSRTDSTSLGIAEGISTVVNSFSSTDTASVSITEASAFSSTVVGSETTAINIADSSSVSITNAVSASDTSAVSLTDDSASVIFSGRTDSSSISVSETSLVAVTQPTNDTSTISIADSSALAVITFVSAADTAAISISDNRAVQVTRTASDSAAITIVDVSQPFTNFPGVQPVAISVTETSTITVTQPAT
ncbi:MAG TPA: metallophosphoesterase, partial [Nitrospira sp.]|nr:metallophosphoesterase [Nitrospira sp.]